MKKIPAAKFKAGCLTIMDEVQATREPVLITKRGRPVAKLVALDAPIDDFIGHLKGIIKIVGDITSPVEAADSWEVLR